ncbi:MAG: TyeA family type III secretion system gatekeeper subunit [Bdellovibrionota bacterium]
MSGVSRLSTVSPVVSTNEHNQERNIKRKILNEKKLEAREAESSKNELQQDELFNEIFNEINEANNFFDDAERNLLEHTRISIPAQFLNMNEVGLNNAENAKNIPEMAYLTGEEINLFLEFIDVEGKKKQEFQKLSDQLEKSREGEEESLIDDAARNVCKNNKAEIYLMLCYLFEDLIHKKGKEKLRDRLKKIIAAFERQESAYLFNFFSFQSILQASPNSSVNASMLDKMANISAGNIKLNSLRQSLQFIAQTLPDKDMYKMVSLFMKFQAKNLKKISTLNEGREGKEELANILQQERNLIILNSLYNQCKRVFFHLKKVTPIDEKYADFMAQVITIIESSVVSIDTLQNMEKLIGIKQITLQINRVFVKNFEAMLAKMPQPIFYSEAMREKLLDSLKNITRNIDKLLEPKSSGLSFLRTKNYKNNNI